MSTSPSGASPPAANSSRGEAQAAQNIFNAKDAAADTGSKKGILIWSGLVILLIVIAGFGSYVWLQMAAFTPRPVASHARPGPLAPLPAPASPLAPAPPGAPQVPGTAAPVESFVPTQQPTSAIPAPPGSTAAPAPEDAHKAPARGDRAPDAMAALLRESSASGGAAPPVRLAPSRETPRVAPDVSRGYRDLAEGDLAAARRSYGTALLSDPTSLDALLGMATVEARGGNRYAAATYYGKALAVDPRNATAQAGLAALQQDLNPDGLETHVRAQIAQNPQSAPLHFALGNVMAAQSRWNEAQVEYFEAFRLEPASADFAYNLAVSLDHLKQPRLAAEYYARAVEASRSQATQFDPAAAARRLAQIKG